MTTHDLALTLLQCSGADARDFLHNQLTQSVNDLQPEQARLFAYCSPRGRVMANGLIWTGSQPEEHFYLLVHQSVADSFLSRLQMYVLRSKVTFKKIQHARISGIGRPAFLAEPPAALDAWNLPIYRDGASDSVAIQAPGTEDQPTRFWLVRLEDGQSEPEQVIDNTVWQWQDLSLGWPWVQSGTSEVFIPQNLNLDILPAVNFKKGCFPGQEIVARSHYRATIRRRALLFTVDAELLSAATTNQEPGTDIMTGSQEDKPRPAGRVVNTVIHQDKLWLLAETNLDFILDEAPLYLADAPAARLRMQSLPFQSQLPWDKPMKNG